MKKIKRIGVILLIFLLNINCFAAIVSDNDGSAFVTKAEFDALKNSFNEQIRDYNASIDGKIDGAIASYLAGINISTHEIINILYYSVADLTNPYVFCVKPSDMPYVYGRPALDWNLFSAAAGQNIGNPKVASTKIVEGTITSSGNEGRRILVKPSTIAGNIRNVWVGYVSGIDKFTCGVNQVIKDDNDWSPTVKWFPCPAFHINNDQVTTINNWIGTMFWNTLEDAAYTGSSKTQSWAAFFRTTTHTGSSTYEKKSINYNNIILEKYHNVSTSYPVWFEEKFDEVRIPKWTTSLADGSQIYSETIETAWDASAANNPWKWTFKAGRFVQAVQNIEEDKDVSVYNYTSISHGNSQYADTNTGRSGYKDNRYVPIINNYDTLSLYNIYQNDGKTYVVDTATNVTGYKLDQGIPMCEVGDEYQVIWKPKFVSNVNTSVDTTGTTELYLKYGPFTEDETGTTIANKVGYTRTGNEIKFTADRKGTVFAKWSYGSALDLNNSKDIEIIVLR